MSVYIRETQVSLGLPVLRALCSLGTSDRLLGASPEEIRPDWPVGKSIGHCLD